MEAIRIGFLGCGNIGCGVYKLLETHGEEMEKNEGVSFDVKRILTTCSSACHFHSLVVQNLFFAISEKNRQLVQKLGHMSKRTTREKLISYLSDEDPEKLWQSHIFGKSVGDMIQEGLHSKLMQLPEEVRGKLRGSLTRIVNEGANGLICLIL